MPKRCNDYLLDVDSQKKKSCSTDLSSFSLNRGEFLKDVTGKSWRLGKTVGVGGFGEIYLASDNLDREVKTESPYVAKVESHKNGPLFVEVNCYLRIAKLSMIEEWKKQKRLKSLGMPHYVASGSHVHKEEKYRFLILPRFDKDLEKVLEEKRTINLKTVLTIANQIIDVLQYIHSKGYIHSDIKASNILLSSQKRKKGPIIISPQKYKYYQPIRSCRLRKRARNLRPQNIVRYVDDVELDELLLSPSSKESGEIKTDQVYLLDYGLASKYLTSSGEHKPFCVDERKAHAGTVLFCSQDAHKGVWSRRSDIESLGYNIIYWLTGNLPWSKNVDDPERVHRKKQKAMTNIVEFLESCFDEYPKFLIDYFESLQKLEFQEEPNYHYFKLLFKQTLKEYGYKDDSQFDFDNTQGWTQKQKKMKRKSENCSPKKRTKYIARSPLKSNIPIKVPLLRKKIRTKKLQKQMNWSKILIDPETILKQARERRNVETNDLNIISNICNLNIKSLNPTYAMIEVFNKCKERNGASPLYRGDSNPDNLDGYTPAMMQVWRRMQEKKELECEVAVNVNRNGRVVKRCINTRRRKYESHNFPPHLRTIKSHSVVKKDNFPMKKVKEISVKRTYSLRG